MDDAVLLRSSRKGDMDAMAALVAKYQDRLYNAILRMCGNRDDAAELCQEAFVKALEGIGLPAGRGLLHVAVPDRHEPGDQPSSARRAGEVSLLDPAAGGEGETPHRLTDVMSDPRQPDPSEQAAESDAQRQVMVALVGLDEEFRSVVVLRDIEDMNYDEISRVLGVPIGTVKSRLYRARHVEREIAGPAAVIRPACR